MTIPEIIPMPPSLLVVKRLAKSPTSMRELVPSESEKRQERNLRRIDVGLALRASSRHVQELL
jgi:hypothetical protein